MGLSIVSHGVLLIGSSRNPSSQPYDGGYFLATYTTRFRSSLYSLIPRVKPRMVVCRHTMLAGIWASKVA